MRICVTAIVMVLISLVGSPHTARADTPVDTSVGGVALGLSAFVGDNALTTVATCGG